MRFFSIILGSMLLACSAWAQEDNVATATTALQDVLTTLKQSVEQLKMDNDHVTAQNKELRQELLHLQMQLGQLIAQGDVLNNAVVKLEAKNPRRTQEITRLETENFDLDDRNQGVQGRIKMVQQSLDAAYQEDQKLLLQLKDTQDMPAPVESQTLVHQQKEKLRLMKMIYDSQQRQETLHESIMQYQQNTPLLPAAGALAHQQLLKEEIKNLEDELAQYPPEKPSENIGSAFQWNNTQLRQLEVELKALEQNYSQLKILMGEMSKKAQDVRMTVSQHVEGEKLQSNIDDLTRQSVSLRADLDDLRTQMIDLDKRKSHLQVMIQQMP